MTPHRSIIRFIAAGCLVTLASCDTASDPIKPPGVASVRVTPETVLLEVGASAQLSAVVMDENGNPLSGRTVSWASSNPGVAQVSGSGMVTGVAAGGPVAVRATSEGKIGAAEVTVAEVPVAEVSVAPENLFMQLGATAQLTAVVFDADGNELSGRETSWTSNFPEIVSVSSSGMVTGESEGGPVTVTATSEGKSATARVTAVSTVLTGIRDIRAFLEECPTNDPIYARLREDFDLRIDGDKLVDPITCSEPYSAMPIEDLTNALISVQTFRTAYYMSLGMKGILPWTEKGLYEWMATYVDGVNLRTNPGLLYCCDVIDGKKYVVQSLQDAEQREYKRNWRGISGTLGFFAHEIRHADSTGGQGHTTGCEAFPEPTDPAGCDPSYDLSNLGSYGVQYWLALNWATGYLNIGIGCLEPETAQEYARQMTIDLNLQYRRRFVSNAPAPVTLAPPYGGPCVPAEVVPKQ